MGITGTGREAQAVGTMEVLLRRQAEAGVYSYANKENSEELVDYRLVKDARAQAAQETALAAG